MVAISRKRIQATTSSSRRGGGNSKWDTEKLTTAGLACVVGCFALWTVMSWSGSATGVGAGAGMGGSGGGLKSRLMGKDRGPNHPDLHLQGPNSEAYNAIAQDIIQTLQCKELLNKTSVGGGGYGMGGGGGDDFGDPMQQDVGGGAGGEADQQGGGGAGAGAGGENPDEQGHFRRRRRLEDLANEAGRDQAENFMDDFAADTPWDYSVTPTAAHLFCLVAMGHETWDKIADWKGRIRCDVSNSDLKTRSEMLDVWSTARAEMPDSVLKTTLEIATEHERDLVQHRLNLWAPMNDDGIEYMLSHLNEEQKNADHGGIYGLETNLGHGKLFVDVGSGLGLTSMAISLLYPGTKIVGFEPAAPNWLLQELNWHCHADKFSGVDRTLLLSGVGPSDRAAYMAKFMWRPSATTSTRSWTPASERRDSDVELKVKLRPWHSVLAEADVNKDTIDVLNVHCEGCEYNLIPSLTATEFDAIRTVMGSVHWGYIPEHKLPSSSRAKITHERLCKHENFARGVKECCAFPNLPVLSSVPGEVLVQDSKKFPPQDVTVKDVAGSLCDNFDTWAAEHHLYDIESDWGWFQISSMAEE